MKFRIQLPFFPGFYESDLENSDTSYWAIREELDYYHNEYCGKWGHEPEELRPIYEQLTEEDLDFDYQGYEEEVRNGWVWSFRRQMPKQLVLSLENVEMTSPRYYNFETDRLWADVELSDDWMDVVRKFMVENADWLRERIKDEWSSCDGFISFMSNNFDDLSHDEVEDYWGEKSWYWHLFSGQSDKLECYISTIIGYMMYHENNDIKYDLVVDAIEDVFAGQYVYITDDGKDKLEKLKAKYEEDIREGRIVLPDPNQMEIPFEE